MLIKYLQIYNEKGLLKQLDFFKVFQNKFQYFYIKNIETYILRKDDLDNKNIILFLFLALNNIQIKF